MIKFLGRLIGLLLVFLLIFSLMTVYRNSKAVLTYAPLVRQVLAERQQTEQIDENLVLAMIYTESKGRGQDILQASESLTGSVGNISSPQESLEQGLNLLEDNLAQANQVGTDTWTAVQAYNLGPNYIAYVAERGGKTNLDLARRFSRDVVAPSLGNVTGKTYRYYHPIAIFYGKPYLYQNGGNSYYVEQVQLNLMILKVMSQLIN